MITLHVHESLKAILLIISQPERDGGRWIESWNVDSKELSVDNLEKLRDWKTRVVVLAYG